MPYLKISLLILNSLWLLCNADYTLEVRAISYSNPSNKDYNGDCCDVGFFTCNKCDVDFHFCIRAKGTSGATTSCWYSKTTTDDKSDSSGITFPATGPLYSGAGLDNPVTFYRAGSWPGSFQLMVRITDSDGSTADDLVDRVLFDVDRSPSTSWTNTIDGVKYYNRASFSAQFRIRCNNYYYSSSCSVYCKPTDTSSGGHYDCSSVGQKVCKNGWTNPSGNCLTAICSSGCSESNGYCNTPGQCLCNTGWIGSNCDQCIPKTGCSTVHGHCDEPNECICETGYGGPLCINDIDVCGHQSPCTSGAISCTNTGLDSYYCNCIAGYTGTNCETDINECDSNPCQNDGVCFDQVNDYICQCITGYTGDNCEIDINECVTDPCQNNGTCNDLVGKYTCSCVNGFIGTDCTGHECDSTPCQNNGTCVTNATSGSGYTCDCTNGYEGPYCESDIDECDYTNCGNGTCNNTIGSYQCDCDTGYNGGHCSVNIDDCITDNCSNTSVCIDGINSYTCACNSGYTGNLCDITIDYCEDKPCQNGAICNSYTAGYYTCNCVSGYTGSDCDVNIDDCDSDSCSNGATCIDQINSFTCTCTKGYTGTTCNTAIDYCDPFPCQDNEECTIDTGTNSHECVVCAGDVCKDQAAVIGTDSTTETSEPVNDNLGMMIGLIVSGIILLCCCCCLFWLICVCCVYRKRKAAHDSKEMNSFEDNAQVSQNPLFISPDLFASSNSYKKGSSLNRTPLTTSIDNPYNNVPSRKINNPLYSIRSISPSNGTRPISPSKKGYHMLDEDDHNDIDQDDNDILKSRHYNRLEVLETPYATYSSTDNPYVGSPSVNDSLPPPLPPPRLLSDESAKNLGNIVSDDSIVISNPYETIPFVSKETDQSIVGHFNPYESLPDEDDSNDLYQEIN